MKNILKKGFTLIELLIVIGILGILIAAVLFTLNPAEAQRKGRDVQRLRDLGTLQTIMENLSQDNLLTGLTGVVVADSSSGLTDCNANWLTTGLSLTDGVCNYATKVPIDPSNAATTSVAVGDDATPPCVATDTPGQTAYYYVVYDGGSQTYEINVRQESKSGCTKLVGDGGDGFDFVEAGTNVLIVH